MTNSTWRFSDPPNLAVIVHRKVLAGEKHISLVTHDSDDGGWQFLSHETEPLRSSDGAVVGLGRIVALDPTLAELADLPIGWRAWRSSRQAPWQRAKR